MRQVGSLIMKVEEKQVQRYGCLPVTGRHKADRMSAHIECLCKAQLILSQLGPYMPGLHYSGEAVPRFLPILECSHRQLSLNARPWTYLNCNNKYIKDDSKSFRFFPLIILYQQNFNYIESLTCRNLQSQSVFPHLQICL